MLSNTDRVASAVELVDASEEQLFAALGAASMAFGTPDEILALGAAMDPGQVVPLRKAGFVGAADVADSPAVEERGRTAFEEFLAEYGEHLKAAVCGHYKSYLDGELDKQNLVTTTATLIAGFATGTIWAPLVGILAVLVVKAALNMLCDV